MDGPSMRSVARDRREWTGERGWRHHVADVGDLDLHYVTAGDPADEAVVLLHGFPECWWAWRHHVDPLADEFRVIVPDMRGYNLSDSPDGVEHYRFESLTRDVAGLVRAEGHESAHVVGHDWGGVVAFGVGLQHPDLLDKLVVLNAPYPGAFRAQYTPRQLLRSWYVVFFQLPWVPERLLAARDFALLERLFRTAPAVPNAYTDEDVRRYKQAWAQPGSLGAMIDYYRAFGDEARQRILAGGGGGGGGGDSTGDIRAETLLLWGERDRALGPQVPRAIARTVDDVSVEYYPEATHWLHAEFPERTAEDVRGFLVR